MTNIEWPPFEKVDERIRRRIAFHEAGHAVVGFHLAGGDVYIEKTDGNPAIWAHAVSKGFRFGDYEAMAVVAMAGDVAESIDQPVETDDPDQDVDFPFAPFGAGDWVMEWEEADPGPDFDVVLKCLMCLCNFDSADPAHYSERLTALEWLALHTHRLLTEWWADVELVAAEFLSAGGRVSAERMRQLLLPGPSTSQDC